MNQKRRTIGVLGLALFVSGLGLNLAQPTAASWTNPQYQNARMSTGQLYPVTSLTCNSSGGLLATSIGFAWTQPVSTGNGLVPTGYTLKWAGAAGTGQRDFTGLTGSVPGTILSVAGTSQVTIYANFGTWHSPVSTQSRLLTTVSTLGVIVSWTCG